MYKVIYCEKQSFFDNLGDEKSKLVSREDLIKMLQDPKIHVISCHYVTKEAEV